MDRQIHGYMHICLCEHVCAHMCLYRKSYKYRLQMVKEVGENCKYRLHTVREIGEYLSLSSNRHDTILDVYQAFNIDTSIYYLPLLSDCYITILKLDILVSTLVK